jgi:hypothetical protein
MPAVPNMSKVTASAVSATVEPKAATEMKSTSLSKGFVCIIALPTDRSPNIKAQPAVERNTPRAKTLAQALPLGMVAREVMTAKRGPSSLSLRAMCQGR